MARIAGASSLARLLGRPTLYNSHRSQQLLKRSYASYAQTRTQQMTRFSYNAVYRRLANLSKPKLKEPGEARPNGTPKPPEPPGLTPENGNNGAATPTKPTRKQLAMKRLKSRFQNLKLYLNRSKNVQKLRVYLSQNKRFQRLRLYLTQKRLKFKGIANRGKRREKLQKMREKFKDKSLAVSTRKPAVQTRSTAHTQALRKDRRRHLLLVRPGTRRRVYIVTLAGMNAIVFLDYLTSEHVRKALNYVNITSLKVPDVDSPFAKFTVAYIATKLVEPLRLVVSILLTISVTKILKR